MSFAYKVGHDCEFFVYDPMAGEIVPVCGRLGGTKQKPIAIENSPVGTTYQEDGVACEIGMTPINVHDFLGAASVSLMETHNLLGTKGMHLTPGSCQEFSSSVLKAHPAALIIGCSPDNNAYERGMPRTGLDVRKMGNRRFTGGHLHFSCPLQDNERLTNGTPIWAVVQMMDALALMFSSRYSMSYQGGRYSYYGMPGLYRPKPYGLEYRTPSNAWLWESASVPSRDATMFIDSCATVVQACSELPGEAVRSYYDRIDFAQVAQLLALSPTNDYVHRSRSVEFARLLELKEEMASRLGELR